VNDAASFAPYASPENVLRVLDRVHKNGLRGKVDADFLGQLGIGDGMVNRTIRALEFLGFTKPDEEGEPTSLLEQYIVSSDEDAQALLREAVASSYDLIFRAVHPETADRTAIHTAFKPMKPQGQWTRMVTLFLGLCKAAGMTVKDPPNNRPGKTEGSRVLRRDPSKPKPKIISRKERPTAETQLALPQGPSRALDPALVGIMGKIPDLETAEDLEAWIAMFRAAFSFVKKLPQKS